MKKIAILFILLMFFSGVSATMTISKTANIYNLGDKLYVSLGGLRGVAHGNFNINLVCSNRTINLVKLPARAFSLTEDQSYSIPYEVLNTEDLGVANISEVLGNCQVVVSLGTGVVSTKRFKITNGINIDLSLNKTRYNPDESVLVKIKARKDNGKMLDGFIEGSNATSFKKSIKNGVAEKVFSIPKTAESGIYYLTVRAYDGKKWGALNKGTKTISYIVNSVPTSLVIGISRGVAIPGKNFTIGADVFDQAGVKMNGTVLVKIISPTGEVLDKTIQAGKFTSVIFNSNSTVGTWKIISQFDKLINERKFKMKGIQKVSFNFEDAVLVVKNIGNIPYNKTIGIAIGNKTRTLNLKIGIGEIRKFSLNAPTGKYNVVVGSGAERLSRQILLTGNTIQINDFKGGWVIKNYSFVWVFLIIILGGLGGVLFMRYRKTRLVGKRNNWLVNIANKIKKKGGNLHETSKVPSKTNSISPDLILYPKNNQNFNKTDNHGHLKNNVIRAESSLVLGGEKYISSIVALNIKNYNSLKDVSMDDLKSIIEDTKGKGVIDFRGDYIFILFNPLITKTYRNEILAVKSGVNILLKIIEHNKKFENKIEFGIGIHNGELIANKHDNKFKYTGIGNSLSLARKMADIDSGRVVISDSIRKKLIRDLDVIKGKEVGSNLTYIVRKVASHSSDMGKLRDLLARNNRSF